MHRLHNHTGRGCGEHDSVTWAGAIASTGLRGQGSCTTPGVGARLASRGDCLRPSAGSTRHTMSTASAGGTTRDAGAGAAGAGAVEGVLMCTAMGARLAGRRSRARARSSPMRTWVTPPLLSDADAVTDAVAKLAIHDEGAADAAGPGASDVGVDGTVPPASTNGAQGSQEAAASPPQPPRPTPVAASAAAGGASPPSLPAAQVRSAAPVSRVLRTG